MESKLIFDEKESNLGSIQLIINSKSRFIKVIVKNNGPIKAGYPGEGNKAWLFVDEIQID